MNDSKKGLLKSTLLITFCSVIGIAFSFISQLVIAYYFGANIERDAYFVASTVPLYLTAIFSGSFGIIFIPQFINIQNNNEQETSRFLSTIFWSLTILLSLLTIIGILCSSYIMRIMAAAYSAQDNNLASNILIVILPSIIFNVLSNILSSLYQIKNNFFRPALAPIITTTVSLIFVTALSNKIGIFGLSFGFLLGSIASFLFLLPILKTFKLKLYLQLKSIEIYSFIKTLLPLFLTGILFRSTGVFERMIASTLPQGCVSYLGYTSQILLILATFTSNGIGVSLYPTLSKLWAENRLEELKLFFNNIFRIILIISLPISVIVIFYGDVFIKIIFERGKFTPDVTLAVSKALAWSMGAYIFQNLGNIVTKMFYVSKKTTVFSIVATIEIVLYIVAGFLLTQHFSFAGLAMALSVSSMINILLSLFFINKMIIKIEFKKIFLDTSKLLIMTISAMLFIYLLSLCISFEDKLVITIINIICGLLIFYVIGMLIKVKEILYLNTKFRFIIKKKYGRN